MIWTIYKHTNKTNGKSYIGYTCQKPQNRWDNGNGYIGCTKFWRAIQKYGWDSFTHTILAWTTTEELAIIEETFQKLKYDTLNNGYNCVLDESKSVMFGRKHTEESKIKIGAFWKGKKRKPFTNEHRQKIKEARAKQVFTEESNRKRSETQKGRIPGYSKITSEQVLAIFNDPRRTIEIANEYGMDQKSISNIKNGRTWKNITKGILK